MPERRAVSTSISWLKPKVLRRLMRSIAASAVSYSPSHRDTSARKSAAAFAASTFPATRPATSAIDPPGQPKASGIDGSERQVIAAELEVEARIADDEHVVGGEESGEAEPDE
jgi:hypothetical protein